MGQVFVDMAISLDGFIAGPNAAPHNPLGDGGTRMHEWMFGMRTWRERMGLSGGDTGSDDDIVRETFDRAGANVMGRRMFDEGEVNWPDPPPFYAPVFVLTSAPREPWERQGGTTFTFVTEGIHSAVKQARAAAGDKDVQISGGADTVRQALEAGLVDEIQLHLTPILLGSGIRLFDGIDTGTFTLESTRVAESAKTTHLRYRVSV
ncbi:dihydrofolate reductase [Haloechinothrix sp. YIM 98757]|uniref:Dihydrofolate reductase n=1 Tax=Haloechinothrix aidingensis TaxID=2752311 RepID=A0A838AEA8_9PSEU|nr:dihydrofolate reductase family protein [Haloechinothrix aidingensis]MBA0127636.1 dihydrofolate reductase [Haloechinothrix aidingensis]